MHPALNGAGDEAIRIFEVVSACDRAVVTDIIMPDMEWIWPAGS